MSDKKVVVDSAPHLEAMTLEELFDEGAKYGKIDVFSSSHDPHPNCYRVVITFQTREHTDMKAKSPFRMPLKGGLIHAISNAEDMVRLARGIES